MEFEERIDMILTYIKDNTDRETGIFSAWPPKAQNDILVGEAMQYLLDNRILIEVKDYKDENKDNDYRIATPSEIVKNRLDKK